ncbi:hypothetical protein B0J11DRAFT_586816 [Dendryphion nanum]|uniref:Uncharacterized protein n=1 Tax=Dendryphion nanum TaxID=256645 RepID=A0A9P9I6V9_9PLEO|nr:hypothetical protein B0J11DRAFT_586816 [Dendryphion nanum]
MNADCHQKYNLRQEDMTGVIKISNQLAAHSNVMSTVILKVGSLESVTLNSSTKTPWPYGNLAEIEMIIHTRDNNQPNLYGTHSTTMRKLTFSEVAALYEANFGRKVTFQAMQKRYHQWIVRYREWNAAYPRAIVYADYAPKEAHLRRTPRSTRCGIMASSDTNTPLSTVSATLYPSNTTGRSRRVNNEDVAWLQGYGASRVPAWVKDQADMDNYFNLREPIKDSERPEWITIEVHDEFGRTTDSCDVRFADLRASSRLFSDDFNHVLYPDIAVSCGVKTLTRYIDCVSPVRRKALPEFDFEIHAVGDGSGGDQRMQTIVRTVEWNIEDTVSLYSLAAQFKDDHVRCLVLEYWHALLQQNSATELDATAINQLFFDTEVGDPARSFWVSIIQAQGIQGQFGSPEIWHSSLVAMLAQDTILGVTIGGDAYLFGELSEQILECAPPEFYAIAHRLLRKMKCDSIDDLVADLRQQYEVLNPLSRGPAPAGMALFGVEGALEPANLGERGTISSDGSDKSEESDY